jgi:uncharacterized membrane protein YgdD (TMEM256/DUF423 family)
MPSATRIHTAIGALYAAAGVALMAAAAHLPVGDTRIDTAALFLFAQGPAIIAASAARAAGLIHAAASRWALSAVILGVALFSGDLGLKGARIGALFPMAAPAGGVLMIGGWVLLVISALFRRS